MVSVTGELRSPSEAIFSLDFRGVSGLIFLRRIKKKIILEIILIELLKNEMIKYSEEFIVNDHENSIFFVSDTDVQ
ncbi:hypothetical protein Pcaca04_00680 [Pectobacterium carotovorum subsp. carotovorum]|nr:hypothetical protein Pcaca04_00680 [Pectobacterium carotovorum subsp. carotovorum]